MITQREIVGLILWWAEGTKSRKDPRWKNARTYPVEITNTNADIIRLFLHYLRTEIGVDEPRLKLQLQIHQGDDKDALEAFWSKATGIPLSRFTKTIIRPIGNKAGKTKGTCKIRYIDKKTYLNLEGRLNRLLSNVGA